MNAEIYLGKNMQMMRQIENGISIFFSFQDASVLLDCLQEAIEEEQFVDGDGSGENGGLNYGAQQGSVARLINAMASIGKGREYLGE